MNYTDTEVFTKAFNSVGVLMIPRIGYPESQFPTKNNAYVCLNFADALFKNPFYDSPLHKYHRFAIRSCVSLEYSSPIEKCKSSRLRVKNQLQLEL